MSILDRSAVNGPSELERYVIEFGDIFDSGDVKILPRVYSSLDEVMDAAIEDQLEHGADLESAMKTALLALGATCDNLPIGKSYRILRCRVCVI